MFTRMSGIRTSKAVALGSLLWGSGALGQAESDKMTITGSRLKQTVVEGSRIESEGVAPTISITHEQIEKSGVSTVSELLQNLTISSQGTYANSVVNDSRGTATNADLRGIGPDATLILLDGRRLPDEGGLGIVDLSTIPLPAVERIEILKESASALYGSDAIGGVINIITKKDLKGGILSAGASRPDGLGGNEKTDFSYLQGTKTANLRMLTMVSYHHQEPTFYRDRDWTKNGLSTYSFPGNYSIQGDKGGLKAHANCNVPESDRIADGSDSTVCGYNYGATSAFSPETTNLSFLNNVNYALNEHLSLFSTIRAVRNDNRWNMAPNAGDFTIPQGVAQTNQSNLGLAGETIGGDVEVRYRGVFWGNRVWEEKNTLVGGTVGVKGSLFRNWDWELSAGRTANRKDSRNPNGFMLKDQLVAAISDGRFNPFETTPSGTTLAVVNDSAYQPFVVIDSGTSSVNLDVTGQGFELPGGPLGIAVGAQRLDQTYNKVIDSQSEADNVFGVNPDVGSAGKRDVNAAYVEVVLPVSKQFELQLAARHDEYSDFGGTTNPKAGFKYTPAKNLLFRGSAGTGFKAPTLAELHKGDQFGLFDVVDKQVNPDVLNTEVEVVTKGNTDLHEEKSFGANGGIVYAPVPGLTLGAEYWYLTIKDRVAEMSLQDILDAQADEGASFPDVQFQREADGPDGTLGTLKRADIPVMNLGESQQSGADVNANYNFMVEGHRFDLTADYARKFYSRGKKYPGGPMDDTLREFGEPAWRNVNTAAWGPTSAHTFTLRSNTIGKHGTQTPAEETNWISVFHTYDSEYSWNHPWDGRLTFGILNFTDAKFPRDPSQRDGDSVRAAELYSADGRVLYMKATQVF